MKKLLLPLLLAGTSLLAFDTRTHVWIAQEVINDLEDGKVTIEPFGDFSVDPDTVSAILNNKRIYRMGNIGPDGFPDVVGGQVTVHPGLEDGYIDDQAETLVEGWKSDTWFQWILSKAQTPQEKAFALGFLGHGAADIFAHTYVNMYAGDIFDMNDGETDVEKRHIYLEKYISDRLPPFKNSAGETLGEAHELVAINDELPISFIKETLLMNDDVAEQYALSGTANYLAKLYEFRQKVAALDDDNTEVVLDEDLETAAEECDSRWYPGKILFSIFSSKDEACEEKSFLDRKREDLEAFKAQYGIEVYSFKKAWLAQIDHAIDEYIKASSRMSQGFMDVNGETYSQLTNWLSCYSTSFTDPTTLGAQAVEGSCLLSNKIASELSFLDDIRDKIDFTTLSSLKSDVNEISNNLGLEIINLLGVAAIEVITVKDQSVSHDSLNEQFGMDESDKHLLLINDVAQRVEREMALNMKGELNPNMYHVLYNAVVLSKLSLLSADQLNTLMARAGVADSYQYTQSDDAPFSILFNSIKTIDGNHQWLYQAPPYPRSLGFDDTTDHFYGYMNDDSHGFKFFESDALRFNLFDKIFKGPLALGLETPAVIHKSALLSPEYPYLSCASNPFPNGIDDKRCEEEYMLDDTNQTEETNTTTDQKSNDWWDELMVYLKSVIMEYFKDIIGEENIISIFDNNDSVKIITTVPDSGIEF